MCKHWSSLVSGCLQSKLQSMKAWTYERMKYSVLLQQDTQPGQPRPGMICQYTCKYMNDERRETVASLAYLRTEQNREAQFLAVC